MYVITWPLLIGPELNALAPHCVELARRSVVLVYLGREGGAVNVDENTMTEGAYISVCCRTSAEYGMQMSREIAQRTSRRCLGMEAPLHQEESVA